MTTPDGINILFRTWGTQRGWVSVPAKQGKKWFEKIFEWPTGKEELIKWVEECIAEKRDIYWCPTPLTGPKRIKENIPIVSVLYADLDLAPVSGMPVKPSVLWQSSPGRHQCLWYLREPTNSTTAEKLNKSLSYASQADKGGWDLTQVLRIPGTTNYKYDPPAPGKVSYVTSRTYTRKHLRTSMSAMSGTDAPNLNSATTTGGESDELEVNWTLTWQQALEPYMGKLKRKALELLQTQNVEIGERSDKLWELGSLLLEAGVPREDVCAALADSPWNKFKGRRDEHHRIIAGVLKVPEPVTIQINRTLGRSSWVRYGELLADPDPQPGWMIREIWQRNSHGMLAGEPKTYKSMLSTELAISVAGGVPFLGQYKVDSTGPVLVVQEENAPWIVQDRLLKISTARGLNDHGYWMDIKGRMHLKLPADLPIFFLNNLGFDLTSTEDQDFLESSVAEFRPKLIILDPLNWMLGDKDDNNARDLRPVLMWLMKLKFQYDTSVLVIHHWNKGGKSERGGQRMLGSGTLHAWVESAMYTKVVDERAHKISVEREFRAYPKRPDLQIQFEMEDPGNLGYEVFTEEMMANQNMEDIVEIVKNSGGKTVDELLAETGMSRQSMRTRLDEAVNKGLIGRIGGGRGRGKKALYTGMEEPK